MDERTMKIQHARQLLKSALDHLDEAMHCEASHRAQEAGELIRSLQADKLLHVAAYEADGAMLIADSLAKEDSVEIDRRNGL